MASVCSSLALLSLGSASAEVASVVVVVVDIFLLKFNLGPGLKGLMLDAVILLRLKIAGYFS